MSALETMADVRGEAIRDLVRGASLEVSAHDRSADQQCRALLAPGATVYITFVASDTHHGIVAAAARLRRAGFNPVPHVAARYLAGFTQLDDYLARASGEAGVTEALVIAGDVDRPAGPYHGSLQLLETGLFAKYGIRRIGIAGYPEGHPKIATRALDEALRAKLALVQRAGLEVQIVTQFCFDGAPIAAWIARLAEAGFDVPVRVGLAGPASVATLAKFAVRCGIGKSIRALVGRQSSVTRLLVEAGPEAVMVALARAAASGTRIAGLHFFTFGGIARTATWLRAIERGSFALTAEGDSFRVSA